MNLDEVDRALFAELRRDGRASFESLGAAVGLSRTAARARVRQLLDAGVLHIEAIAHPAIAGHTTFGHLFVQVAGASSRAVAQDIAELDTAPFVSVVAGRSSVVAEVRTSGLSGLHTSVERIRALPGVLTVDTVTYTEVVKDAHLPPGDGEVVERFALDDRDRRLLDLLRTDARMPYADLADAVGLSRPATRTRVLRMLRNGVVTVTGLVSPTAVGDSEMCGFQAHLASADGETVEAVAALPAVHFLARAVGRCDLIGTIIAPSRGEVADVLDRIRQLDGVRGLEAWWHLELVKERYSSATE
jgi:DNA-binding Lrp family transcriptional regulator